MGRSRYRKGRVHDNLSLPPAHKQERPEPEHRSRWFQAVLEFPKFNCWRIRTAARRDSDISLGHPVVVILIPADQEKREKMLAFGFNDEEKKS